MADSPQAETKMAIDESHPHVKALNDAGISTDRLTSLVNSSPTPIKHESVSQQNEQTAANDQAEITQLQSQLAQPVIPALDTQGFQAPAELTSAFANMMAQILNPPVPANPQLASTQPQPTPQNG